MKHLIFTILLLVTSFCCAQTVADFEDFNIAVDSSNNNSGEQGYFVNGNVLLPNIFVDGDFSYWSGWAISSTTDTTTPGFTNDLSAITGGGAEGSTTYAVTYIFPSSIIRLTNDGIGGYVAGMYVTNNTYAYLSMLEGDGFAKKFGGETGNDPDFFKMTVKKFEEGALSTNSIDFYLADYRFEDNSQDYIVDEWTWLDLSSLGNADSLEITMSSSDNNDFGIKTPTYVCVDNITTANALTAIGDVDVPKVSIYPNPFENHIQIDTDAVIENVELVDVMGRTQAINLVGNVLYLDDVQSGVYFLRMEINGQLMVTKVIRR